MPVPKHIFDPPFNIVRSSQIALGVPDLGRSRAFYAETLGLIVEDARPGDPLSARASSRHGEVPTAQHLGFKVGSEEDLDKAARFFKAQGDRARVRRATLSRPYADGRRPPTACRSNFTLPWKSASGCCSATAPIRACSRNASITFNVLAPNVPGAIDFYAALGFRLTKYAEEDRPSGHIAAAWMHLKGNVHEPCLHQWQGAAPAPSGLLGAALQIIHLCDLMVTRATLPISNADRDSTAFPMPFFLYVRCPDGHRLEVYSCDYQTMDPDHEPIRWSLRDPRRQRCGSPRSWFEEGSQFAGVEPRPALFEANVVVAE
jgi:catechol 2,3-dioxygenase